MEQNLNKQKQEVFTRQIDDDEINLVDLFLIIWKRKMMIIVVTLLMTISAAGISLLMPKVYKVVTILEPAKDAEGKLVENPQSIREHILGGTYDQIIAEKLKIPLNGIPGFKVSVLKQTNLMKISVESSEPQQAVLALDELFAAVSDDIQNRLDIKIRETQNMIKSAELEGKFLHVNVDLVKDQIAQIGKKMIALENGREKAMAAPRGDAMAVLLYSNELQDQQIYLNDLQQKLTMLENQKSQMLLKVDNINLKLAGIKGIKLNRPANIPDKPIKPKKTLIVTLAFVLGLMGGIMLAFFVEFLGTARQRMVKEG